jgi:hypothetical protein
MAAGAMRDFPGSNMRFADACLASLLLTLAAVSPLSPAGCAQETYYELTDRQSGEITYSTTPPAGEAAAPGPAGAQSLVGRNSGRAVNQRYIVREISRREYQQRTAKVPAGEMP